MSPAGKIRLAAPKGRKPSYGELLAFLGEPASALYVRFKEEVHSAYQVIDRWHRFEPSKGWVYGFCRNYRVELIYLTIGEGCFHVDDVRVSDEESLRRALQRAKEHYDAGYEERYARIVEEKKDGQRQRAAARSAVEKAQMEKLLDAVPDGKLNRFKWPPKVPRRKLKLLYEGEAAGRLDGELLSDVGFALYARCKQAGDVRACMDKGQMVCHFCGAVLQAASYTAPVACACGQFYTYREYRRSCNAAGMPGGRAEPVFRAFAERWPACRGDAEKMLLIDWLIHECHVTLMSGEKGRTVCANLIEGTLPQLRDLLETLAGRASDLT